jgi:hypothetical protein
MREILPRGSRVRLHAPSPALELTTPTGTVIGPDTVDGCVIVELDDPATVISGPTGEVQIRRIREYAMNLTLLPPTGIAPAQPEQERCPHGHVGCCGHHDAEDMPVHPVRCRR